MGKTLKIVALVILFILHWLLAVISILLAIVFAAVYWVIWIVTLLCPKSQQATTAFEERELSLGRPIEDLIGPKADNTIDAIFEGGGVKALAQIGAVQAIESLHLRWGLLGGTSGGAIIASALAAGKNSRDIWKTLFEDGLQSIVEVWYLPRVGFLQKKIYFYIPLFAHLFIRKGMVSGSQFLNIMRKILQVNGQQLRFKDLLNAEWNVDKKEPRYTLKVVATDITRGVPIVLPDDLPCYWEAWNEAAKNMSSGKPKENDSEYAAQDWWPVANAIRMSMSIPFFFTPVKLHLNMEQDMKTLKTDEKGKKGQAVFIVDGGVASNFPIWLYDRLDKVPPCPTFGFLLDEKKGQTLKNTRISDYLMDLGWSVINTGLGAMDKRLSRHDDYRTVRLGTHLLGKKVNTTDFGLSPRDQADLVSSGFQDAVKFLKKFNWNYYIENFRRNES